ncbi:FHIPEP family type III secretion protein [Paludibacterium denitrificans]|uniref:FHIPEP family type III secretion protein n=1 Tax=Paludibacterium denitrificans TaxID=2675226 RepID=UPI0024782DB8|nr:FHIPEP family type III secretion protein [Paludibacterium denitrificans]
MPSFPACPAHLPRLFGSARLRCPARQPPRASQANDDTAAIETALLTDSRPELDWNSLPYVDVLGITPGYKLVGLLDPAQGAALQKRANGVRQSLSENFGLLLPPVGLRDDLSQPATQYSILLSGSVVAQANLQPGMLMAIPSPTVYGELDGTPGIDPAYNMPVIWIRPEHKAQALGLGYQVVDGASVIATHLSKVIREHLPELFRHDDVAALLARLTTLSPKLAAALEKAMTHSQLLKVFRVLLTENISLKDIVPIASTLLENSETTKDPILLAAEVRCTLRRANRHRADRNQTGAQGVQFVGGTGKHAVGRTQPGATTWQGNSG